VTAQDSTGKEPMIGEKRTLQRCHIAIIEKTEAQARETLTAAKELNLRHLCAF